MAEILRSVRGMAERTILINRAPVLTLWATTVAERLGFAQDEALSLGKAVAGLTAQSKDPQTQNRYSFVRNNPMTYIDPTGAMDCDPSDPSCIGGWGGGGGCDPILDPLCGICDPTDPFCEGGGGGGGGGGRNNPENPRPFPWPTLTLGFFNSLENGAGGGTGNSRWEQCRINVLVPCVSQAEDQLSHCLIGAAGLCLARMGACVAECRTQPWSCGKCLIQAGAQCTASKVICDYNFNRSIDDCMSKFMACGTAGP